MKSDYDSIYTYAANGEFMGMQYASPMYAGVCLDTGGVLNVWA